MISKVSPFGGILNKSQVGLNLVFWWIIAGFGLVDLSKISFGIKIWLTDFFRLYAGKPALHKFSMKSSIIF